MPGVTVLPNSPGLGDFRLPQSESRKGNRSTDSMTVSEIKEKAKHTVQKEVSGASASSLVKTARNQFFTGIDYQTRGDLKAALAAYVKAASLVNVAINSQDQGSSKEITDFMERYGEDMSSRLRAVEEKLKAFEKQPSSANSSDKIDGPITKPGGSIADRLRALQENGLTGATSKRISRTFSEVSPTSAPASPKPSSTKLPPALIPAAPSASAPSPHVFVAPSSLGPPSPGSSPPSSPKPPTVDVAGFTQAFPPINELDDNPAFQLLSISTDSDRVKADETGQPSAESSSSPSSSLRNFSIPVERPSSTPITPITNAFPSRPSSPPKSSAPHKPSALNLSASSSIGYINKPILPVSDVVHPRDLQQYMQHFRVLALDVRDRAQFEKDHIQNAAVCIEPSVLQRSGLTIEKLEESMAISPEQEAILFSNREKFDLVVVLDADSTDFGLPGSPLSVLVDLISQRSIPKMLKRAPMLLVGGLEAWHRDANEPSVVQKGVPTAHFSQPLTSTASTSQLPSISSSYNSKHPFLNGYVSVSPPLGSLSDMHTPWTPRAENEVTSPILDSRSQPKGHRPNISLDHHPSHTRIPAEIQYTSQRVQQSEASLVRRPAILRPHSQSLSRPFDSPPQSLVNGASSSPITYPQFPRRLPTSEPNTGTSSVSIPYDIQSPPQASINSSQLSRKRSDFVDQSQEALAGFHSARPIDYPELSTPQVLRPPPVAASPVLERQDNRPRLQHTVVSPFAPGAPAIPRIASDYPVTYWFDIEVGTSGLKNLGNTCYMNAPIQCLNATVPFSKFFIEGRWQKAINYNNPLGSRGKLAGAFAKLLREMWSGDLPYISAYDFRRSICQMKSQYNNSDQHDSQEFLSFLLDGIHEDLNRILVKPSWSRTPDEEAELERLPPQIASEQEWRAWRNRNDSIIVDFFQGQFRNRLQCLTCQTTSTTYNVFSILQLPITQERNGKATLQGCLDAFFHTEVLDKDDAWDCPKCKTKRRASKKLSLARLPPVLLIHLKRFEANGRFSDKIDTFVDFPLKGLDLTDLVINPLGGDRSLPNDSITNPNDARAQIPPFRYDLYGVTNHSGNLSSGHYTAFISSRGGWKYCDDSSIKTVDAKQVITPRAYVLFYKRTKV